MAASLLNRLILSHYLYTHTGEANLVLFYASPVSRTPMDIPMLERSPVRSRACLQKGIAYIPNAVTTMENPGRQDQCGGLLKGQFTPESSKAIVLFMHLDSFCVGCSLGDRVWRSAFSAVEKNWMALQSTNNTFEKLTSNVSPQKWWPSYSRWSTYLQWAVSCRK